MQTKGSFLGSGGGIRTPDLRVMSSKQARIAPYRHMTTSHLERVLRFKYEHSGASPVRSHDSS
jgi:hypothetical protein